MKIYTVEEIIDLGNHVLEVYYNKEKADQRCLELQLMYNATRVGNYRIDYEVKEYDVLS